jgi:hypothetical protein
MPYKSIDEANDAIKGLKPPVDLPQANHIAAMADAIAKTNPDGAWPMALANFKQNYEVKGGAWVKKGAPVQETMAEVGARMAGDKAATLKDLMTQIKAVMTTLEEVVNWAEYKAPQDFVVEQFKEFGGEIFERHDFLLAENDDEDTWHLPYQRQGVLDPMLMEACYVALTKGIDGVFYEGEDAAQALAKLKEIYATANMSLPDVDTYVDTETVHEALAESVGGVAESVLGEAGTDSAPLTMRVKLIEPGFGNAKDKHYYGSEMLRRCADVFKNAKMFETNHDDRQKSTRTWVSTITGIVDYSPTGAPIAEVVVHDPSFAERVRNLSAKGLLGQLPCSILADGQVKTGTINGQKANIVEAITAASSVDWVTRAGAGGQAMSIQESAQEVIMLDTKTIVKALMASGLPQMAVERLSESEWESEEKLTEAINEQKAFVTKLTEKLQADFEEANKAKGGGKVFALGEHAQEETPLEDPKAVAEQERAILNKFLGGR